MLPVRTLGANFTQIFATITTSTIAPGQSYRPTLKPHLFGASGARAKTVFEILGLEITRNIAC